MGLKEVFSNWNEKRKEEKEEFKQMERELKFKKRLEDKQKTPMQKEHEFYEKEKDRERLKELVKSERLERNEKMKKLSDPFNKDNNLFKEHNDIMKGGFRLR